MQLLYNSDSFAVVRLDPAPEAVAADAAGAARGGFEIVDKRAGSETWLAGALADRFIQGAQALAAASPSLEDFDEYIAGFTGVAPQPLCLH
jgi:hypothetical protein